MSPPYKRNGAFRRFALIALYPLRISLLFATTGGVLISLPGFCDTQELGQNLSVLIVPGGKLSVPSSLSLTNTGTVFNPLTGALPVSYRIRNGSNGTNITVTIAATSNFSPAGGPSVANGDLTYTCGSASLGTACSGTQTIRSTAATTVLTVSAASCTSGCSSSSTNTETLNFSLTDNPTFSTGTYSTSVVFTMSSL